MAEEIEQERVGKNQIDAAPENQTPSPIAAALSRENPLWVSQAIEALGETTVVVPREHLVAACAFLKATAGIEINFFSGLCGFDRGPGTDTGSESNYHLFSTTKQHLYRL